MGKSMGIPLAISAALLALLISACGDGGKESPHRGLDANPQAEAAYGKDAGGVAFTGSADCEGCHSDKTCATKCHLNATWKSSWAQWSGTDGLMAKYTQSGHFRQGPGIDASAEMSSCRSSCHDPVGDGKALGEYLVANGVIAANQVPAKGLSAVTCEACHGAGANHRGRNAMPVANPDEAVCVSCHGTDGLALPTLHARDFPEGTNIGAGYLASKHARGPEGLPNGATLFDDNGAVLQACAGCHTDEGAKLAAKGTLDGPVARAHRIQCRTCHDAHKPSDLLRTASASPAHSAEFRTCTSCHALTNPAGDDVAAVFDHGPYSLTSTIQEDLTITDTHYAKANTWKSSNITLIDSRIGTTWSMSLAGASSNIGTTNIMVTGYAMDFSSDRVCRNCHNQHEATKKHNEEWKESGHADRSGSGAWARYNWSFDDKDNDRRLCQKCHTTSGVIANLTANEAGGTYQAPLSTDPAFKPQMLECNGCHESNAGTLRQPGAMRVDYSFNYTDKDRSKVYTDEMGKQRYPIIPVLTLSHTYDDLGSSNVCMSCHVGRQSGETVARLTSNLGFTVDFTDFLRLSVPFTPAPSAPSPHDATVGGQLFGGMDNGNEYGIAYAFPGRTYRVKDTERHWLIGRSGVPTAFYDGKGPCVGCHFGVDDEVTSNHGLKALKRDESGEIAGPGDFCLNCHKGLTPGGKDMTLTAARLLNQEESFEATVKAFKAVRDSSRVVWKRCIAGDVAGDAEDDKYVCLPPPGYTLPSQTGDYRLERHSASPVCTPVEIAGDAADESYACVTGKDGVTVYHYLPVTSGNSYWPTARTTQDLTTNGRNNMGANFNYSVVTSDAALWVHNRYYAKQVIWNSIDWLDDNLLNDSTLTAIGALPASALSDAEKAKVRAYLSDLGRPLL